MSAAGGSIKADTVKAGMVKAGTVKAWDWPTRAFHWALVLGIASAWASFKFADRIGDPMLVWHRWNGYFILVLLVFRVIWGFVGSSTSRFSAFLTWPWEALRYLADAARGRERKHLGHNPAGTWMIVALFAAVFAQATLGLFSLEHNELVAGPLKRLVAHETSESITKLHVWFFNVILALIALHVTVNVLYGVLKRDPLIKAMVTGRKPAEAYEDQQEARIVPGVTARAVVCFIAAAAIVLGGIVALGGRIL